MLVFTEKICPRNFRRQADFHAYTRKKKKNLKICWFAVTRVCFFKYTRPVGKIFFYHFEMEKIALILIYNTFVTENFFFRNEHQKKNLTRTFLVDPVGWRQTNIFLRLALEHAIFSQPFCRTDEHDNQSLVCCLYGFPKV